MRTTFDTHGGRGRSEPSAPDAPRSVPRPPRPDRHHLRRGVRLGNLVAATYDALTDRDAGGVMGPSW